MYYHVLISYIQCLSAHIFLDIPRLRGGGCDEFSGSIVPSSSSTLIVALASQGPVGKIYKLTKLRALASHEASKNALSMTCGTPLQWHITTFFPSFMQLAPMGQNLMKEL